MKERIRPLGYNVLLEMEEVKDTTAAGIFLGDVGREQANVDVGYVRAIGNIAFAGFTGCDPSSYPPSHPFFSMKPHEIWGIKIGDKVEYQHLEGQISRTKGYEKWRIVPDSLLTILVENCDE